MKKWRSERISFETDILIYDCVFKIDNPLIVSQISSIGGGFCVFTGLNGSSTVVFGEATVDVVPPQVQIQGDCDTA